MKPDSFVHLHLHTEYSLLDGACRIKDVFRHIREIGQTAAAITDHGNMYGAVEFWKAAIDAGIKPIIGCEVLCAQRSRFDKEAGIDDRPYHLTLLCENNNGYQNLIKLVSLSSTEGLCGGKPRVDTELLMKYHEGLICLSGCMSGEIPRLLLSGQYDRAKGTALKFRDIFGENNFFLEICNHGLKSELSILSQMYRLSAETGIPIAATNDCHYITKSEAEVQKVLHSIGMNKPVGDNSVNEDNTLETEEYYIKSAGEMYELFIGHEEAVEITAAIAERCNVEFRFGQIRLPEFRTDDSDEDNQSYFRRLCYEGMYRRYGSAPDSSVTERMEYELRIITEMGYTDYFLIVWDFINYARKKSIPVGPGRGSGAGSLCAYCIGITGIDPMKYNLLFERFLNPERVSMPDFDIDFCVEGRQAVKDYVVRRYGSDRVSEIIAFDTLKARAALRDVGRILNVPYQLCDKTAKLIEQGSSLAQAVKESPELGSLYQSDRTVRRLIDTAAKIEGMPRHITTHAAGVVISAVPLSDIVPMQKSGDVVITQYAAPVLESLGLLKMDFLGLRNLTIIRDAVNEIRRKEPDFDIDKIPYDDKGVYEMLSAGDTGGVFQFESSGITQRLMELHPEHIGDLIAMLSLYRPGPMKSISMYIENKRNPEKITYKHPLLKEILSDTYGCIVYQEQVMEICRRLAGYSYGHADVVRRAMSKKKQDVMMKERDSFVAGAVSNGIDSRTANEIFDEMMSFASYAFNKSHAAAYACLAYQTAYLKYHYRGVYTAALMSSVMGNTGKLSDYISMCRSAGISVLRPDVNRSLKGFAYKDGKMYFGLLAVKNVGTGLADKIVLEREKNGPYTGLQNFCQRLEGRELNKKALENLIKAGAFDGLGLNRRQMTENYERLLEYAESGSRGVLDGQLNLLDAASEAEYGVKIPYIPEYAPNMLLKLEKEAAGMYLTGSPLSGHQKLAKLLHLKKIRQIQEMAESGLLRDGDSVGFLCLLQEKKLHTTKKGDRMCFLSLSDETGETDAVIFPELFAVSSSGLTEDSILIVNGKISVREENVSVLCGSIFTENDFEKMTGNMRLCIKTDAAHAVVSAELYEICRDYPGYTGICFYLTDLKKLVAPRNKVSLRISSESVDRILKIYSEDKIGLIR